MAGATTDFVLRQLQRLFESGTFAGATDEQLLDRFLDGDEGVGAAAFAVLVERHGPMVFRVCRRVLGDPDDAEDASQATFLVLACKAHSVRRRGSVASWLFGVAYRVARRARVDAARRRDRERRGAEIAAQRGGSAADGFESAWPELDEELARLPEKYRAPLVLFHLEGLTLAETAGRLGCPARTVQRRLSEGRERLRIRLTRRGVTHPGGLLGACPAIKIPVGLAEAIVRAAIRVGAGRAATVTAGGASASVAAMTEGAIRTMFWTTMRSVACGLAAVGTLTSLAAGFAFSAREADLPAEPRAAPVAVESPLKRAFDGPFPATAQRHVLNLQVADDGTGAALIDAEVSVLEYRQNKFHIFPTDAKGRLRVEYPFVEGLMPVVEVRKPGYVPQRHTLGVEAGNPPDEPLLVRLRTASAIGGVVVNEEGDPIAGVTVVVTVSGYADSRSRPKLAKGREITYEVPVKSDGEGGWRCDQVAPDASKVTLQLIHPDYVSGNTLGGPGLRHPELPGLWEFSDRQVMARGVRTAGRVLDAAGKPIGGAEVIDTSKGLPFLPNLRRARTDADGRFHFHFDPEEQVILTVRARGFAPSEMILKRKSEDEPIEFRLAKGRTIRGRVVDPQGRGVEGTLVYFSQASRFKGVYLRLWTEADGRFRWDEAPDDDLPLSFSKLGYLKSENQRVRPSDEEALFVLYPSD